MFQSSPALTGGCYGACWLAAGLVKGVSILTRPYGRMLYGEFRGLYRGDCFNPHPPLRADAILCLSLPPAGGVVSILTRPYGRMLSRPGQRRPRSPALFQSSPALTGGCYACTASASAPARLFQSSPALTGGCYGRRTAGHTDRSSFNPHPPLRADAITGKLSPDPEGEVFQSSPALTGGCYARSAPATLPRAVSILTRPYGRMLSRQASSIVTLANCFNPHPPLRADAMIPRPRHQPGQPVSILTRPYGRMLCRPPDPTPPPRGSFNPHPPLRADAMPYS